ncbi:MAG: Mrp/NBP35 family ATP-binding protein [Candidatus Marinimicrobia bacterium]|nr:Mrp/NBP35 family ATP-binding protein [Candidatus Neomarinimicrobiota bacterium]
MEVGLKDVAEALEGVLLTEPKRSLPQLNMVRDIEVSGESVKLSLALTVLSAAERERVQERVRAAVEALPGVKEVAIDLVELSPQELNEFGRVVAVMSGKGGVGKSTVAVNLAAALSQTGTQVGILDLDIYGPSLPLILGINDRPFLNEDQKIMPLEAHGMRVMSFGLISGDQTPVIWRGPLVAKMTQQFFKDVAWGELDVLILDLPPGTGDVQLTLVQQVALTGAVIVTTPQELALQDVRKGANMFSAVNTPLLGVIENMSALQLRGIVKDAQGQPVPNARMEFEGLGEVSTVSAGDEGAFQVDVPVFRSGGGSAESKRLQVPLLGQVPLVPDLVVASDNGVPFVLEYPEHPVTAEFRRIAASLLDRAATASTS